MLQLNASPIPLYGVNITAAFQMHSLGTSTDVSIDGRMGALKMQDIKLQDMTVTFIFHFDTLLSVIF